MGLSGPLTQALNDLKNAWHDGVECYYLQIQGELKAKLLRALDQIGQQVIQQCYTFSCEQHRLAISFL